MVVDDRTRLDELFACLESPDELVRMRAGDGLEKVCRQQERSKSRLGPTQIQSSPDRYAPA